MSNARPHWGSRLTFVLAAAGSAIGLGNIWKFPYITGVNGGGAFVLVYLITIAMVGLPLMAAEILVGRGTQLSPVSAVKKLCGDRTPWMIVGVLSVLTAFVILSYYSVVTGWTLHYLLLSLKGDFVGKDPETIKNIFGSLYVSPTLNLIWHAVVMMICTLILYRGIKGGIEKVSKILMPILIGLILILFVNSMMSPGAGQGLRFLFSADFSKLTPAAMLEAVGHGFFTLSLGMGTMITYGSYLSKKDSLAQPVMGIVAFDTIIALLAGLVIFPIVFSYGVEPGAGPGLIFQTLPIIFSKMPGGSIISVMFFLLLFLAATTSAISIMEPSVSFLVDAKIMKRHNAALAAGSAIFLFGIMSALSGGTLSHISVPVIGKNFFDSFDYLASNWFLPVGGLCIALMTGWAIKDSFRKEEFERNAPKWWNYKVWLFFLRWVTPVGVLLVFLKAVGIIK